MEYTDASSDASDIVQVFERHIERRNRVVGKLRIGDLNKFYADRYRGTREGYQFPDDDAGREDLRILLEHYALNNPLAMPRIIQRRAPWADAERVIEQIELNPRRYRAKTLGGLLRFTGEEWKRLRLRTIEPIDMTKEERRAFSHALYIERRRRKKRQTPRAEWLARSLSRTKPWEAEGISRSTWERRRNKALTQVGGNKDSIRRHTCVSEGGATSQRKGWARNDAAAAFPKPEGSRIEISKSHFQVCINQQAAFLDRDHAEWLVAAIARRGPVPGHHHRVLADIERRKAAWAAA